MKEREMDLMVSMGDAGAMTRSAAETCQTCGWPIAEPYQIVSRHLTSEGVITWSRCACGRLQAHRGTSVVLRATCPSSDRHAL
jgi:hypothetical protein